MAKDYFQDIIPPSGDSRKSRQPAARTQTPRREPEESTDAAEIAETPRRSRAASKPATKDDGEDVHEEPKRDAGENAYLDDDEPIETTEGLRQEVGLRGIRNINISSRARPRPAPDMRQSQPLIGGNSLPPHGASSRIWIWVVAAIGIIALILFAILSMRPTVITITPRSHAIVFDQSAEFVAYPATSAASGTLPYTVQTIELDGSDITPSQSGMAHTETKASASVTVYNTYSASPVRLIATTRFETPDHLVFRTPNDIVIPGKKGSTPGRVTVTIIADQAGGQYNKSSTTHLTLPGLQKNALMYKGVYADSTGAITGGFVGDKAAVDPAARATAVAAIRTRLQDAALKKATTDAGQNSLVFFNLAQVTYQDLPDTNETNGVGIHERIHLLVPILPGDLFAQMVGSSVSADTENASLSLVGGSGFGAVSTDEASSTLGTAPFHFRPVGNATLVWNVDTQSLLTALAGHDQSSFKTIIANFPSIEAAHARIEPFWKGTFPKDPTAIKITLTAPQPTTGNGK